MAANEELAWLYQAVAPFVKDVRDTLYPDFDVEFLRDEDGAVSWVAHRNGGSSSTSADFMFGELPMWRATAELAESIPDLDFEDGEPIWPRCPTHSDHPLMPATYGKKAVWTCRLGAEVRIPIGELARELGP